VPTFALLRHDGHSAVALDLIKKLNPEEARSVAAAAAYLVNRIIVADEINPGDSESVSAVMDKVRGYLGIGLDELGGDQAQTVATVPLVDIFRTGYGKVLDLADYARKIVDVHPLVTGDRKALRLDDLTRETICALLAQPPALHLAAVREGANGNGQFSSPADVEAVRGVLMQADASAEIFGTALKVFKKDLSAIDIKGLNVGSRDDLTTVRLFNTSICNKLLFDEYKTSAIPSGEMPRMRSLLFPEAGNGIFSEKVGAIRVALADQAGAARTELKAPALIFIDRCLLVLKDDLGFLGEAVTPNPEFIGALLIRK